MKSLASKDHLMSKIQKIWVSLISLIGILVLTGVGIQTYELREKLVNKIDGFYDNDFSSSSQPDHEKWAKKILEGGYILHFRHAEREKWIDVQMYDALESDLHSNGLNQTRGAENDYFTLAVCLNSRGLVQGRAMGEIVKFAQLPIGKVISSPSCRSRQTADLAFGGYDELHRILVHKGPYKEKESERVEALRELYYKNRPQPGTNTIVSAHNSVVHKDMFSNFHSFGELYLEEGGFYVISAQDDGTLRLEHEFHYFKDFTKQFFPR